MGAGNPGGAFETGLAAAHLLGPGLALPVGDDKAESFADSIASRVQLSDQEIMAVADLPPLTNDTLSLLQQVLSKLAIPAYLSRPRYLRAICFLSFYITCNNGISSFSAFPILHIGSILTAQATTVEEATRGFAFGRLAVRIVETQAVPPEVACPIYSLFASHILSWHRPLAETQRYFLAAISKGLETYDINWTSIAVIDRGLFSFFAGESLDVVQAKLEEATPLLRKGGRESVHHWLSMPMQVILGLRGTDKMVDEMTVDTPFDNEAIKKAQANQSHTYLFAYHCYHLVVAVFTGNTQVAMDAARGCEMYLPSAIGSYLSAMYMFYSAILFATNLDLLLPSEMTLLQTKLDHIHFWAQTSPTTFGHKSLFLRTLISTRESTNNLNLLDAFDEAIYSALENGFIQDAALYAEKTSVWLAPSSPKRSAHYLNFARRQYDFWGATTKSAEIAALLPPSQDLKGFGITYKASLTLAIIPSPTHEIQNPFVSQHAPEMRSHHVNNIKSGPSQEPAHPSLQSISEKMGRPLLRKGSSAMSLRSSSTESSPRRNSAMISSSGLRDSVISSELDLQSVMRASLAIQEGPQVKNIILKLVHIIMQTAGANYGCIMLRGLRAERRTLHIEVIGNENKVHLVDHKPLHSQTETVPTRLCEYYFQVWR
jgi:hypothetical protein